MSDSDNNASNMISEIVSEYDELAKLAPYAKQVLTAYKFIRKKRMEWFLKSLSKIQDTLTPSQRQFFENLLKSEDGQELLSEYADTVINTSSKTASVALALLYSDGEHQIFSKSFKSLAAIALKGITEDLVDLFLSLSTNFDSLISNNEGAYPVYFCSQEFISDSNKLNKELQNPDVLIASMNELIQRRLLAPDHATARIGGDEISIPFGITETSTSFHGLISRAKIIGEQLK